MPDQEPLLLAALLCRGVYATSDGDLLTEIRWGLGAVRYPARHDLLRVYTRWANGAGTFVMASQVLTEAGTPLTDLSGLAQRAESTLVCTPGADLAQPGGLAVSTHVYVDLVFPAAGRYWVAISLNGTLVVRVPFWAVQAAG